MLAVRTFTKPSSLNESIAVVTGTMAQSNEEERSAEAAKNSADGYTEEEKSPLANSKNPKSKPGITFAAQDKLPKLPVPDLEASCKKYLKALEPLQSPKEHRESESAVKEFLRSEGPDLQEKLKKYAAEKANYIEQFCMYQYYRRLGTIGLILRRVRLLPEL